MNTFYYSEGGIYKTKKMVNNATINNINKKFHIIETERYWGNFRRAFEKAKSQGISDHDAIEEAKFSFCMCYNINAINTSDITGNRYYTLNKDTRNGDIYDLDKVRVISIRGKKLGEILLNQGIIIDNLRDNDICYVDDLDEPKEWGVVYPI